MEDSGPVLSFTSSATERRVTNYSRRSCRLLTGKSSALCKANAENWLFTGSERARAPGHPAIQSRLLSTASWLNSLEPYAWLKDTLEKLPAWPFSRIDELLPLRHLPDQ